MNRRPWVLLPAGPFGWASYNQILPQLKMVWSSLGFRLEPVWFPRPQVGRRWADEINRSASALIFPLGVGHYDAFWTLKQLRFNFGVRIPAVIMIASDVTKGSGILFDYHDVFLRHDRFITNCTAERQLLKEAMGPGIDVRSIPLPVDTAFFRPASERGRRSIRTALGVRRDEPLLVYAGRVSLQKNIHALLAVFSRIKARFPGARLVIAGSYDDIGAPHLAQEPRPRYMHYLCSLVSRLGLGDSVRFEGSLEQEALSALLGACDLQISLTLHSGEDFGYSLAQGMACGAATIVSRWGGGCDFIRGKAASGVRAFLTDDGLRVDEAQAVRLATKLLNPLENERARARARAYAEGTLSRVAVMEKWREATASAPWKSEPLALSGDGRFLRHYRRSKQGRAQVFTPKDPLYRRICGIYSRNAGLGEAARQRRCP